jgi:POT family proton-dependent oligopeptide transporter
LFLLSETEMWERVQYYGMRAFLVLYLVDKTRGLGWTDGQALGLYGWYTGLTYLFPVLGGWIADRYLGQRVAVVIGGTSMMAGQFLCALKTVPTLYLGLLFLILGNGFFKANISTMVGQLYGRGDPRRDSAFTIFYMGINVGAMIGPLVCGGLGEEIDWSLGFASAGLGMGLGVLIFLGFKRKLLGEVGTFGFEQQKSATGRLVTHPLTGEERDRVIVIFAIAFFVIAFWAAYEQGGGLMNLFTDRKIDRTLLGHEVPTTWYQSVNSVFILLLGPPFAVLWPWLASRRKEPSTAAKMGLGLIQVGAGFLLLVAAARQAEVTGKAAAMWMVGAYFFHTTGELCLSPVGLSMVTKLAPKKLASALMGVWFLANFAGNKLAGVIGSYGEVYGEFRVFLALTIGTAAAGVLLLVISPVLQGMTHGAESPAPPAEAPAAIS